MKLSFKNKVAAALVALGMAGASAGTLQPAAAPTNPDQRPMLDLLPGERDLVLQEMRMFLQVIHEITAALTREDWPAVAKSARTMGSGAANEIPPHVVAKLPDDFKQMAGTVHMTFDTIALDAESMGDPNHTLTQLSGMLQTCNACHSVYQIPTPAPQKASTAKTRR
jgi:hypothetical protein